MSSHCRLCNEPTSNNFTETLSLFDKMGNALPRHKVILQHYGIQIQLDEKSTHICGQCWRITNDFHGLYETVQAAAARLTSALCDVAADDKGVVRQVAIVKENQPYIVAEHELKLELNEDPMDADALAPDETELALTEPDSTEFDDTLIKDELYSEPIPKRRRPGRPPKATLQMPSHDGRQLKHESATDGDETKYQLDEQHIRDFFEMSCDICRLSFQTMREAMSHYRRSHQQAGYLVCCEKKFFRRCKALEHIRLHINPSALQCDECGKTYTTRFALTNHKLKHDLTPLKPHACHVCTQRFAKKYQLGQHLRVRHLDQNHKPFGCDICGKFFVTKYVLSSHIKSVHENAYAHMCHICAKTFKSKKVHDLHQMEHLEHEPPKLQCNICGSWLKHEDSLRKHIARHTETEMLCTLCNKMYPSKTALGNHVRYVHSERSYQCTLCDKAFKKPVGLKEHMALHTGIDLYRCPYCSRTFKSGANMHSHRKKEHFALWTQDRQQRLTTKIMQPPEHDE